MILNRAIGLMSLQVQSIDFSQCFAPIERDLWWLRVATGSTELSSGIDLEAGCHSLAECWRGLSSHGFSGSFLVEPFAGWGGSGRHGKWEGVSWWYQSPQRALNNPWAILCPFLESSCPADTLSCGLAGLHPKLPDASLCSPTTQLFTERCAGIRDVHVVFLMQKYFVQNRWKRQPKVTEKQVLHLDAFISICKNLLALDYYFIMKAATCESGHFDVWYSDKISFWSKLLCAVTAASF